jgi:hypothetical protein
MAEAIIGSPLLLIIEHLVGFIDLFKFLFGPVVLVDVRMIFPRQLPVGAADLLGRRRAADP